MTVEAQERLIVALDAPHDPSNPGRLIEMDDARWLVDQLHGIVKFVKIGWPLYMASDRGHQALIDEFRARGMKVFLDLKFGDVAETVRRLVLAAVEDGVEFLTLNTTIDALRAAVRARGSSSLKILTVTLLTNQDAGDLREIGINMSVPEFVLWKAEREKQKGGVDGVIASGREAAALREKFGRDFLIVTPGIRPAGVSHHEQKRVATPAEAVTAGADYLVVGRPITQAPNPRDAAIRIIEEMQRGFDSLAG